MGRITDIADIATGLPNNDFNITGEVGNITDVTCMGPEC